MPLGLRSLVTINGITASLIEHAACKGIGRGTLLSRMRRMGTDDPLLLLQPATPSRKPKPSPSLKERIKYVLGTKAGKLATAKRLGDYASLIQTSP
ncbi:hypothetical protein FQP86_14970 [Cobetia crustatorum]|uniref:Uncharacterized protein n=1 Tax=Cobetia crustatorum TaxID=553385 RepID=A0A558HG37_9GAMM|nr:hypothetical protein FQP86_14970 [Cobetia crustatorum]